MTAMQSCPQCGRNVRTVVRVLDSGVREHLRLETGRRVFREIVDPGSREIVYADALDALAEHVCGEGRPKEPASSTCDPGASSGPQKGRRQAQVRGVPPTTRAQ